MDTKQLLKELPRLPGIYLFKNANGEVLYIGKAKSIKNRVTSYFRKSYDWKIIALMEEYADLEYILTKNETEALLLEAQLIKKHQPKYNRLLKAGQPFIYILFTKEKLPQIKLVRNKKEKGTYIGPFLHKQAARKVYWFLMRTFKLSLCNKKIAGGCLDFHIGNCPGSCMPGYDLKDYQTRLDLARAALTNNQKKFIKTIKESIAVHNAAYEFEKSKRLNGYLADLDLIFNTIRTHFSEYKYNDEVYAVATHSPFNLVDSTKIAYELKTLLNLDHPAFTIDCFDISHFQSHYIVGSCIRFTHGKPDKNKFRRFKINTLDQQNDYAALQEIVSRRYKDPQDIPDLLLIDGGKGQLNAIKSILPQASIVSLAKREELLFGEQFPEGYKLDLQTEVGRLLIALRDYAHHFAISYHRLRRMKAIRNEQ